MSLGENITARRKALGLTQTELAGACGVTLPAVNQFERNLRIPNAYVFAEIARALGVTMDALMNGGAEAGR